VKAPAFKRSPLPSQLCNVGRLWQTLEQRGLDGLVAYSRPNVLYLSGFAPPSNQSVHETNAYAAVVVSRHAPDQPVIVVAEFDLAYFLSQPSWITDVRPYATLLLPFDVPLGDSPLDRFIPLGQRHTAWADTAQFDTLEAVDAYGALKYVRQVKTDAELNLLRTATLLNQQAIEQTIATWSRGSTWQEMVHTYNVTATALGGFVRDPGAVVVANPPGADPALYMTSGLEDFVVEPGSHIMWDCHGTWQHYCWDGGKTWVVDDDPLPDARAAFIFFHGLGLEHIDMEITEEIFLVTPDGGQAFFTWDHAPLTGSGQ
jgi:Xaa-Pro aminopeptidase